MDKIIINIHSFIDVITNSSTELFVLDTEKSLEVVREILESAIDLHNKTHNTSLTFKECFEEPHVGNGNKALEGWERHYSSNIENGIILMGADDNSIPYWMWEFIESTFGYSTERFHLG